MIIWNILNKLEYYKNIVYSFYFSIRLKEYGPRVRFRSIKEFRGGKYISIGKDSFFSNDLYLTAWEKYNIIINGETVTQYFSPMILIGCNCHFGAYNHITSINKIVIGNGVLTGKWVTITDNSHGNSDMQTLFVAPMNRPLITKGPVIIKDNVWIGDKVTILSGTTIGEGAVIAANSVITHDVPAFSVVAGVPAKVIKTINR